MNFFKIIIPIYNAEEYIDRCIESIENQTFKDFRIICINDKSEDSSFDKVLELAKKYNNIQCIDSATKLFIGGARNIGIDMGKSEYTLFVDNDDYMSDNECLQAIYDTIVKNNYPDCVRLGYYFKQGNCKQRVDLKDDTPIKLVNSLYIAPWTKCIKSDKVVRFPENTLIEDVSQHIEQCDNIETIAVCPKPIMVWNRDNVKSCSLKGNEHLQNSKRISSVYRVVADLMDLKLKHDYCKQHRDWRISYYKQIIKNGREETF